MFQSKAACKPADTALFFSDLQSKVARAKAICADCPVRSECLSFAVREEIEHGIFGGLTPEERSRIVV